MKIVKIKLNSVRVTDEELLKLPGSFFLSSKKFYCLILKIKLYEMYGVQITLLTSEGKIFTIHPIKTSLEIEQI